ncbi:MAG TPA: tetratricopeptide repeat protein [Pseudacidobacterium sp.]|nr:tetratricopeptide repeat protein [Pseudacidobacterium sp.]
MFAAILAVSVGMGTPLLAQTSAGEQLAQHAQKAQEAEQRNDFASAVKEYEFMAAALPRNAEIQSNLGVALYFNHGLRRAITVLHKAEALNAKLLAPHLFSGLAYYHLSNPGAAAPELEEAVRISPSDTLAHTWLGYTYEALSLHEKALAQFQSAERLQPRNVDIWYAIGQTCLEIGKEKTKELLRSAPNSARVWQLAGEQFELKGDSGKAKAAFAEAHRLRPGFTGCPGNGSVEDSLYCKAHDAETSAQVAFQRVLQEAPNSARAHQIMADSYFARQQLDNATSEYRLVLQADPRLPNIHLQVGRCLMLRGQFDAALHEYEEEEKLQPESAQVQADMGRVLLAMDRNREAAATLRKAVALDRPPVEAYFLLGKAELRNHNENEAVRFLQHYVTAKPDDSAGYYLLSMAYRATGDKARMREAIELYKKTSQDTKERNLAQMELDRRNNTETAEEGNPQS